ncbi:LysR family transcriptional regulator [Teichococcus vastitatis]|uniref:LysR family transcriptional regulator n=1 Tax=Teichococcus vastitatis TaxID=2307076 RepID=A0ABS9W194_9PROT|nr:LysR family transcriptional regulator [Pseudoroseomonas vastitatis]MCI0753065.1 LysR family transcriptional regulator [Pseudoroseomonas vastitatis]
MPASTSAALADRVRLKQLRLIAVVGEQGSLRHAATVINVTQPTATKMLAELEASLGFAVYERRPRGLHVTAAGGDVLAFALRVMSEFDRLIMAMETRRRGGGDTLTVGTILGATPDLIAQAVADMKQRHPLLTIRLHGESSDHALQLLASRSADLAVGRFNEARQHNLYDYEPLGDEALCIVARAGHPAARRRRLTLAALADQRWVMQSMATPARQLLEAEFAKAGVPTPADMVEANSILTMIQLLERSDAVAMLSEPLVRDHVAAGLLRQLPIVIEAKLSGFGILTRRGERLSGMSAEFAGLLRGVARLDAA